MKKLVSILLVVALACTCAFAGFKATASVGTTPWPLDSLITAPDTNYMKFTCGVGLEYDINDSFAFYADVDLVLKDKKITKYEALVGAGINYTLPFDLPFDVVVGAGAVYDVDPKDNKITKILDTNFAANVKLGVYMPITEKLSAGASANVLIPALLTKGSFSPENIFASFKATVKYAF